MLINPNQVMRWDAAARDFRPSDAILILTVDEILFTDVLSPLAGLLTPVIIGRHYRFELFLWVEDSDGEGYQVDLTGGTTTSSWVRSTFLGFDDTLSRVRQSKTLGTLFDSDAFSGLIECKGSFVPASIGTFGPRVAQKNHVSGGLTIEKGSSLLIWEVT